MATNFPTSLDSLTNPTSTDALNNPSHADQHANVNDAVEALEAKVGVNGSAVTTSLDYKVTNLVPVGAVILYGGGTTAPNGYLICNGAAVSRTTYAALFSAIGTRYGVGDGSTTFNVPSMSTKVPYGTVADTRSATTFATGTPSSNHTHNATTSNASANHTHNTTTGTQSANHSHNGTSGNASANHSHNSNWTVTVGYDTVNHTHSYQKSTGSNTGATTGGIDNSHQHTWNANLTTGGDGASHTHNTTTGAESANHTHNGTSGIESQSHSHNITTEADSSTHTHTVNIVEFIYIIKT